MDQLHEPISMEGSKSKDTTKHRYSRKQTKSKLLLQYLDINEITNRTDFDESPDEEIEGFLTLPNLNAILATGFDRVSAKLKNQHFWPFYNADTLMIQTSVLDIEAGRNRMTRYLFEHQGW